MWLFACSLYEVYLEVWQKACTFFIMGGKGKISGTVTHRNYIYGVLCFVDRASRRNSS